MGDCMAVLRWVVLSFVGVALTLLALPDALRDPRNYAITDLVGPPRGAPPPPPACDPLEPTVPPALATARALPASLAGCSVDAAGMARCRVATRRAPLPSLRLSSEATATTMTPR